MMIMTLMYSKRLQPHFLCMGFLMRTFIYSLLNFSSRFHHHQHNHLRPHSFSPYLIFFSPLYTHSIRLTNKSHALENQTEKSRLLKKMDSDLKRLTTLTDHEKFMRTTNCTEIEAFNQSNENTPAQIKSSASDTSSLDFMSLGSPLIQNNGSGHENSPNISYQVERLAKSEVASDSMQLAVVWKQEIQNILLLRSQTRKQTFDFVKALAKFLINQNRIVYVEDSDYQKLSQLDITVRSYSKQGTKDIDLIICSGGDGSILYNCSVILPEKVPPIMSFAMGSLGFLTPFKPELYKEIISTLFKEKKHNVTVRNRLRCVIQRKSKDTDCPVSYLKEYEQDGKTIIEKEYCSESVCAPLNVLNEVVIDRGPTPYLCNLECYCDDVFVTRVQADGLIIATPTGSTAYSLSAGGSLVHPSVPAILFTPICPHSLSFRPVLFPKNVTLKIRVPEDARSTAWVSFDGRDRMEINRGETLIVSMSRYPIATLNNGNHTQDWFASISNSLRWNERVTQESFSFENDSDT